MRILKYFSVFVIGGIGYGIIELLWRGRTHWTMLLTGGFCFLIIYFLNSLKRIPIAYKCAIGAASITVVEFFVGYVVNLMLNWKVWDYSMLEFNIMGQVCLLFCIVWYFLCLPSLYLCRLIDKTLFVYYENFFENRRKKELFKEDL